MKDNETRNISEFRPEDGFECAKCGIDLREWCKINLAEDDDDAEIVTPFVFKFCPNCGRKIIEEESEDGE